MKLFLKGSIFFIVLLAMIGCAPKLEVSTLSQNAFVTNSDSSIIISDDFIYPLFTQAVANRLKGEIIQDGYSLSQDNFTYKIEIRTLTQNQYVRKDYEPMAQEYTYCNKDGNCTLYSRVVFVPCFNIHSSASMQVNALNINTNESISFVVNNNEGTNSCNRYNRYGFYNGYNDLFFDGYNDGYFLENISGDNVNSIAKKIKNALYPIKTISKTKLKENIESSNINKRYLIEFKNSYDLFKNKDYMGAINLLEAIKSELKEATPDEVYYNLGLLYEYLNNYDKSLENYNHLSDFATEKNIYIQRVTTKQRYKQR